MRGGCAGPGRVLSPGGWVTSRRCRPGWDWLPDGGGLVRLDLVPWWVRAWSHVPLLDRLAHAWMWRHGGFEVFPPPGPDGGGTAGVREPRRPHPPVGGLHATASLPPS